MAGLKMAVRTLAKTPFLTGVATLSLALGIGANAAIFSLFDQMLLRSLPVQEPDRLVNLGAPGPKPGSQSCGQAGGCDVVFSYPMFKDLQQAQQSFTDVAAHVAFGANMAYEGRTMSGQGFEVSGSYFPVLGTQPFLGRLFGPSDDQTIGAHPVAVLGYDYWENDLGADRSVLNKTLLVNGQPMTIVGVAARGFKGTTLGTVPDVYVPLTMREAMQPGFNGFDRRSSYWAYLFARLKPGVSIEQARAELNTIYHGIVVDIEAPLQEGMSASTLERFRAKAITLEPGSRGQSSMHDDSETPLRLLFGITGVVLLIACANIANLLLARGASRGQEMAIRGSLGAARGQLLKQLLTESVLLAVLGGLAGLLVARWTLGVIGSLMPPEQAQTMELVLSTRVLLFTGAVSLLTGFVFGLYPALHSTRPDLVSMLKASTGQPAGAKAAQRFRTSLVTAQIALSMALLVAAGLFIKSLSNIARVDLGLDATNVVTFGISPQRNGYEPARNAELFRRTREELAAIPGVIDVSSALVALVAGSSWGNDVSVEGFQSGPDIDSNSRFNEVGPGFFSTMGMPLVGGREFTESDVAGAPQVAVINEAFTRKFNLDPATAVGKYMATGGGSDDLDIQIVGVVKDAKYNDVKQAVPPLYFLPAWQDTTLGQATFYVRSGIETDQVLRAITATMKRIDPSLPLEDLKTLETQINDNVVFDRVIGTLSAAFAVLATVLAAVGLYGVLAYTVAQRTREFGLRMALGAPGDRVRRMVLAQVGRMVLIGGVIGIVGALALGRAAQSLLFGLGGSDPWVMTLVAVVLSAVAFGAGYLPAARASRVDPMQALRYE